MVIGSEFSVRVFRAVGFSGADLDSYEAELSVQGISDAGSLWPRSIHRKTGRLGKAKQSSERRIRAFPPLCTLIRGPPQFARDELIWVVPRQPLLFKWLGKIRPAHFPARGIATPGRCPHELMDPSHSSYHRSDRCRQYTQRNSFNKLRLL